METLGTFDPADEAAVHDRYEALGPAAQTVTREVATAMDFDRAEYAERVTSDVVASARDALFASLLVVHAGTRSEFEAYCEERPDREVRERGHPEAENAAWHDARAASTVVAATFAEERDAAVATLRRQAFGTVYREVLGLDE